MQKKIHLLALHNSHFGQFSANGFITGKINRCKDKADFKPTKNVLGSKQTYSLNEKVFTHMNTLKTLPDLMKPSTCKWKKRNPKTTSMPKAYGTNLIPRLKPQYWCHSYLPVCFKPLGKHAWARTNKNPYNITLRLVYHRMSYSNQQNNLYNRSRIEIGMRSGITMVSKRYAKPNNPMPQITTPIRNTTN